jgi:hypothetical protein
MSHLSVESPTLSAAADLPHFSHFRCYSHFRHSFNYNIFPDTLFMQNKANFRNTKNGVCSFLTMRYGNLGVLMGQKTNPIQSQFNPKQTQFNPIQSQNKPNQSQFGEGPKRAPISSGPFAHGHRKTQIIFDLAIGVSIESDVTQKSSVVTEIMRKG